MRSVTNSAEVEDYFGYWPKFCDGRILSFSHDTPGPIHLEISYIDSEQNKKAVITICFHDASNISLNELLSQNILDHLKINDNQTSIAVELESAYGLFGSFNCKKVEVTNFAL